MIDRFGLSERSACSLIDLSRSTFRYKSKDKNDHHIRIRMREIAQEKSRYGYRRIHVILKREGLSINHKKTERIYREEGLSLKKRKKKRHKSTLRVPISKPEFLNEVWAMDFMSDSLYNGRRFRVLNIIDIMNRECLVSEVDTSISGKRVARILDRLLFLRGKPKTIVCDNGPEFTSIAMDQWAYRNDIELRFISPGKPIENAFIESFNGKFRDECLNDHWFMNFHDARKKIDAWVYEYNYERPHSSLDNMTQIEYGEYITKEVVNL